MPLTEETIADRIEILEDGRIQVREATVIKRDGVEIARTLHRKIVDPGADVTNEGFLFVTTADDPATSVLSLTSGVGGTVINRIGSSTREGVYNAVVAQGMDSNGALVRGVAYDQLGPKRVGGPFNELPVPLFFDNPLITTTAEAQAAAESRIKTLRRGNDVAFDVEIVPHPALQAGDRITLDGVDGIIEKLTLPLTAGGGSMTLNVREVTA